MIPSYMLSEDRDLEYYRNRCNTLEQLVNQLREENRQLREELATIKETVSALVARNIHAKPDKRHNNTVEKNSTSKHARKSRNRPTHIDCTVTVDETTPKNCVRL